MGGSRGEWTYHDSGIGVSTGGDHRRRWGWWTVVSGAGGFCFVFPSSNVGLKLWLYTTATATVAATAVTATATPVAAPPPPPRRVNSTGPPSSPAALEESTPFNNGHRRRNQPFPPANTATTSLRQGKSVQPAVLDAERNNAKCPNSQIADVRLRR